MLPTVVYRCTTAVLNFPPCTIYWHRAEGKNYDCVSQLFSAFARWDGRILFNLEVGAYRYSTRTVDGRSTNQVTKWLSEDRADLDGTAGVKRLDCEFVFPAFFMQPHTTGARCFATFCDVYKRVEGVDFFVDGVGNVVFWCTNFGKREEHRMPKIMSQTLTVSGAVRIVKTLVIGAGHNGATVMWVTSWASRRVGSDGCVLQFVKDVPNRDLSKEENMKLLDDLVYNVGLEVVERTNKGLVAGRSRWNAQRWREEVKTLFERHGVALPKHESGSASGGWPPSLVCEAENLVQVELELEEPREVEPVGQHDELYEMIEAATQAALGGQEFILPRVRRPTRRFEEEDRVGRVGIGR
eukprot:SAG31_NODE_8411_length_1456_cov_2.630803_1_plen_354_part_00